MTDSEDVTRVDNPLRIPRRLNLDCRLQLQSDVDLCLDELKKIDIIIRIFNHKICLRFNNQSAQSLSTGPQNDLRGESKNFARRKYDKELNIVACIDSMQMLMPGKLSKHTSGVLLTPFAEETMTIGNEAQHTTKSIELSKTSSLFRDEGSTARYFIMPINFRVILEDLIKENAKAIIETATSRISRMYDMLYK